MIQQFPSALIEHGPDADIALAPAFGVKIAHEPTPLFDYSVLEPEAVGPAQAVAARVRAWGKRHTVEAFDLGRDLLQVKELIRHGHFGTWLRQEFRAEERTAQRLMQLAETFDKDEFDIVSVLPITTLYALSAKSTPEAIRNAVVAHLKAGKMVGPRQIQDVIRADREARRQAKADAKLPRAERLRLQRADNGQHREAAPLPRDRELRDLGNLEQAVRAAQTVIENLTRHSPEFIADLKNSRHSLEALLDWWITGTRPAIFDPNRSDAALSPDQARLVEDFEARCIRPRPATDPVDHGATANALEPADAAE